MRLEVGLVVPADCLAEMPGPSLKRNKDIIMLQSPDGQAIAKPWVCSRAGIWILNEALILHQHSRAWDEGPTLSSTPQRQTRGPCSEGLWVSIGMGASGNSRPRCFRSWRQWYTWWESRVEVWTIPAEMQWVQWILLVQYCWGKLHQVWLLRLSSPLRKASLGPHSEITKSSSLTWEQPYGTRPQNLPYLLFCHSSCW